MSRDLGDALADALDGADGRADKGPHAGVDLYVRAVAATRSARRARWLAAAAGLAVAVTLAMSLSGDDGQGPAAAPSAAPAAAPRAVADPDARPGEAGWTVAGVTIDPRGAAEPIGPDSVLPHALSQYCLALDAFARLVGAVDGTEAWHPGAFVGVSGAALDLHVRTFDNARIAAEYVDEARVIGGRCVADLDARWVDATLTHSGGSDADDEALWLAVATGEGAVDAWRLRMQREGSTVVAAVAEPGATDRTLAIVRAWLRDGPR
ncbi:hypothetical protein [Demequina gelatinilytica]|uniref:hypothetical protein n=1 Tax=Demequina gelatinilytica TaxID=1638980 RepID=UPI00078564DA|nr:hypothetical protein [Demequina gelatinilytica]